jgi:ABC-2 type transport system ATP-binding protein
MSVTDAPNAIEIRGLRKTYAAARGQPAKSALDGVDLTVPRGGVFGLLGPNGAGKSTLINILAGLVTKTAGAIRICGIDPDRNPRRARRAIGVVPQELNLDAFFTPREALEFQAGLYGVPKARRWASPTKPTPTLARCPAACVGACWWPRRSSTTPRW